MAETQSKSPYLECNYTYTDTHIDVCSNILCRVQSRIELTNLSNAAAKLGKADHEAAGQKFSFRFKEGSTSVPWLR